MGLPLMQIDTRDTFAKLLTLGYLFRRVTVPLGIAAKVEKVRKMFLKKMQ
jgi:hypothetical protein